MSTLSENTQLYEYLTQKYSTTHYRFEKIFGHSFPYKKLDLKSIDNLRLEGIEDLSGIEELTELQSVEVKGVSDLSPLEKCPNLHKISASLPDQPVDVELLTRLSQKDGMQSCEFSGRGVKSINSEQALEFSDTTTISYDSLAKFNPQQFSQVQSRLAEVQSLITPEMSELERVQTIYRNLLPQDFQYDYSNHSTGSNGYLVNNTMYGPLVEGKGVCSGIASALETALQNAGLDAVACGGWANTKPTAGDAHQWNQVKVDGQWYNLDLTNDYDLKSWRFFMKSDTDRDWAECHYADKTDKYEPIHDCNSTKYDEVFREDPNQRMMRELRKQKEALIQQKINTPLSNVEDKDYTEYRERVNQIFEQSQEDEYVRSQFTLYKNQEQQDRCYHTVQSVREGENVQTLLSQDFEYSDKFRVGMLEPSIRDFSRRTPISSAVVNTAEPQIENNQSNVVQPTVTRNNQPEIQQSQQQVPCNVNLMGENNNMMQINNVDQTFAQQIQQQAPQIDPDIFMQQQAQMQQMQMSQGGPVLSLTMGSGPSMGFVNVLTISMITGLIIGLSIALGVWLLG